METREKVLTVDGAATEMGPGSGRGMSRAWAPDTVGITLPWGGGRGR